MYFILCKIAVAVCHESGLWWVHLKTSLPRHNSVESHTGFPTLGLNISHSSVTTYLRRVETFNDCGIARSMSVKEA